VRSRILFPAISLDLNEANRGDALRGGMNEEAPDEIVCHGQRVA
jgi:hypothetical protein